MHYPRLSWFSGYRRHPRTSRQWLSIGGSILLVGAAVAPLIFVVLQVAQLLRNIPMWDEFETVLEFLIQYQSASSAAEAFRLFFTMANEHCMVTSRVIVVLLYELTGEANFIYLAIIGDLFVLGVVVLFSMNQPTRRERCAALALISLLVFHLQHHENFFSSYASIDHFLVVFLTIATLALIKRGSRGAQFLAGVTATLAVFTLAHGLAVLASGALVLFLAGRRRELAWWLLFSAGLGGFFAWKLMGTPMNMASDLTLTGLVRVLTYALRLIGGVPAIGSTSLALCFGLLWAAAFGWACWKRAWQRDLFLTGVATTALVSASLIAYGRADSIDVSPLSSRYMIQSAMAWSALLMVLLRAQAEKSGFPRWPLAALTFAAAINILCSLEFRVEARAFVQRRIDATRQYDMTRTVAGARTIFPKAARADAILAAAARDGLFRLRPRRSVEVEMKVPLTEHRLEYFMDRITVAPRCVHLKGWMFTEDPDVKNFVPYVMLRTKRQTHYFRGRKERRPDVAKALDRDEAIESGFYFVIPKESLETDTFDISLVLKDGDTALYSNTDHNFTIGDLGGTSEVVTATH